MLTSVAKAKTGFAGLMSWLKPRPTTILLLIKTLQTVVLKYWMAITTIHKLNLKPV